MLNAPDQPAHNQVFECPLYRLNVIFHELEQTKMVFPDSKLFVRLLMIKILNYKEYCKTLVSGNQNYALNHQNRP